MKKSSGEKTDELKELASELKALIPKLDKEGLAFLVEQAQVHLYNMKIMEAQQLAEQAEHSAELKRGGKSNTTVRAKTAASLSIKAADGASSYHLVYGGKWKFFSGEEMLAMVRIVTAADSKSEGSARLYRWIKKERGDLLSDFEIDSPSNSLIAELVSLLKKTFKIRNS